MMISGMFSNITSELSDFNFLFQISFETGVDNFSLARLKSIYNWSNWSNVILIWKMDKFSINKLFITNSTLIVIYWSISIVSAQPLFSFVNILFTEDHFDSLIIILIHILKIYLMSNKLFKVLHGLFISWSSQPFIILNFPFFNILNTLTPLSKILDCEKWFYFSSFCNFE